MNKIRKILWWAQFWLSRFRHDMRVAWSGDGITWTSTEDKNDH